MTFVMGSDRSVDKEAASNEQPQHLIFVPTFLIATTEVTVAQYSVCVNEGACSPGDRRALMGSAKWPVRYLSWSEALEYCRWLESGLKKWSGTPDLINGVLSGRIEGRPWHVTLPSEPEWEKAARGPDARIYPWGNRVERIAATRQQTAPTPAPVGIDQSAASPYGVLDMSGNVGEWTRSLDRPYPYTTVDGREDLGDLQGSQGIRVIRGGPLEANDSSEVRAARRMTSRANERYATVGFRVAISSLESVSTTSSSSGGTLAGNTPPPAVATPSPAATPPKKTAPPPKANPPKSASAAVSQPAGSAPVSQPTGSANPTAGVPADSASKPPTTPSPEQRGPDYASVLAVLQKLEAAYARLDVNEVARIWPSRAGQFRTQRSALNGMSLDVVQSQISINGDTATVRCELRWKYDWKRANQAGESSTANVELTLRRTAGSWVIIRP